MKRKPSVKNKKKSNNSNFFKLKNKKLFNVFLIFVLFIFVSSSIFFYFKSSKKIDLNSKVLKFNSYEEINNYLTNINSDSDEQNNEGILRMNSVSASLESSKTISNKDYAETNNQIQGIDEADFLKNDGNNIYYISKNNLYVIHNDKIIQKINISKIVNNKIKNKTGYYIKQSKKYYYLENILVSNNKLMLIAKENNYYLMKYDIYPYPIYPGYDNSKTIINIYNISNNNLDIYSNITFSGNYFDARLINNTAYIIFQKNVRKLYPEYYQINHKNHSINAENIQIIPEQSSNKELVTILKVELNSLKTATNSILKSYTQNIFVSKNNIYLLNNKVIPYIIEEKQYIKKIKKYLPDKINSKISKIEKYDLRDSTKINEIEYIISDYLYDLKYQDDKSYEKFSEKIREIKNDINKETNEKRDNTIIYKFSLNNLEFIARGEIKGTIINQFSLDEYNNFLRIATTQNRWNNATNNIFILNDKLNIVGSLKNFEKDERIYSVSFDKNLGFISTFRNIDPFLIVNLSDPKEPKIEGKLKIEGYSTYLKRISNNKILSIGQNINNNSNAGIKITLFNISDLKNPVEISHFIIGTGGTYSSALYEHKAIMITSKGLLAIPVNEYKPYNYENDEKPDNFYGFYLFNISSNEIKEVIRVNVGDYNTIRRITYLNNNVYAFSYDKINRVDLNNKVKPEIEEIMLN